MKNWRWHLLPESEQERLIQANDRSDYAGVMEILNRNKVVPGRLSPCCSLEQAIGAVPYALHEGIIKRNETVRKDIH